MWQKRIISTLLPSAMRFFYKPPSVLCRYIHNPVYIPKNVKNIVVVGNNSMVFATLQALKLHGADAYPKITLICPSFWLDHVKMNDYGHLDWGQTILGLPRIVRETFTTYRRDYPINKFITWQDYQHVRLRAINQLKTNPKVEFHHGNLKKTDATPQGYKITLDTEQCITVPTDSFFYFWYNVPKETPHVTQAHTKLYTLPKNEVPDTIIVIGHGLSVRWLIRDFPDKKIVNIKRAEEVLPETPATRDIDIVKEIEKGRLIIHDAKDIIINTNDLGTKASVRCVQTKDLLYEGDIFAATGLTPEHKYAEVVPDNKKLLMPIFDENNTLVAPLDTETVKLVADLFTAPKNIPLGSLFHSFTYLMEITKNISWTSEPMVYFSKSHHQRLEDLSESRGIELQLEFFNILDSMIEIHSNPLAFDEAMEIYLRAFKNIHRATDEEVEVFKDILKEYFNENNAAKCNITRSRT